MSFQRERKHSVDFLFPLLLFFIFAFLAIEVVLFAAKIYSGTLGGASLGDEAGTCISYVEEKIHQNDTGDGVEIAKLDGNDALVLKETIDGRQYETYIYLYQGQIRELLTAEGAMVSAESGTPILEVSNFHVKQVSDRLFYISCTDTEGNAAETYVCVRSGVIADSEGMA